MLKRVQMKQDHSSLQEQQLNTLYSDVRQIFETSRIHAVRSVDFCRVQMYWHLGQRIFKEEQQGKERADYGSYLIKTLAKRLEPEFGSGFGVRQLERARQFYRTYPIATTLRSQLNWSQYRSLIKKDRRPRQAGVLRAGVYQQRMDGSWDRETNQFDALWATANEQRQGKCACRGP